MKRTSPFFRVAGGPAAEPAPKRRAGGHGHAHDVAAEEDRRNGACAASDPVKPARSESAGGLAELLGDAPLRLVIVGHNPSAAAWAAGHYYAHASNRMWKLLAAAGISPSAVCGPQDDGLMPKLAGVGFTDLGAGVPGTDSAAFGAAAVAAWAPSLLARLAAHARRAASNCGCDSDRGGCGCMRPPRIIAFAGKAQFLALFPRNRPPRRVAWGRQDGITIPGWPFPRGGGRGADSGMDSRMESAPEIWVLPSSSGAAALTNESRAAPYAALGRRLAEIPWPLP